MPMGMIMMNVYSANATGRRQRRCELERQSVGQLTLSGAGAGRARYTLASSECSTHCTAIVAANCTRAHYLCIS